MDRLYSVGLGWDSIMPDVFAVGCVNGMLSSSLFCVK